MTSDFFLNRPAKRSIGFLLSFYYFLGEITKRKPKFSLLFSARALFRKAQRAFFARLKNDPPFNTNKSVTLCLVCPLDSAYGYILYTDRVHYQT